VHQVGFIYKVTVSPVSGISSYAHESIRKIKITKICTVYCLVVLGGGVCVCVCVCVCGSILVGRKYIQEFMKTLSLF